MILYIFILHDFLAFYYWWDTTFIETFKMKGVMAGAN